MNKRLLYGIICIVIAAAIAFVGIPLLSSHTNGKVTIVKMAQPVVQGTRIEESDLMLVEVGKYGLTDGTITDYKDVVGRYAKTDLVSGASILPENLSITPPNTTTILNELPSGKVAISFTIKTLAAGLSDKLQSGDIIRIYHYLDSAETLRELQYVKVLAVTDSNGQDVDNSKINPEEQTELSATITVQVSPEQALLIAELENSGTIHVALVLRNNEELAEELLRKQEELLSENNLIE